MSWINRPLSARQLEQIFDESTDLPSLSYHVRRLKKHGVVKRSWSKRVRGTKQRFYRLALRKDLTSSLNE